MFGHSLGGSLGGQCERTEGESSAHALITHAEVRLRAILALLERGAKRLAPERGQGTVEYVGLILLVSLLMVGMVAAMKGFNGTQGTELAELIVTKIKSAVKAGREKRGKARQAASNAFRFAEPIPA